MKKLFAAIACLLAVAGAAFLILAFWDKISEKAGEACQSVKSLFPFSCKDPIVDFCDEE